MTWHGQINRTIWEIRHLIETNPKDFELRRELLRTHFLQRFEYDRSHHIPRDDRSFLFLQENRAPACLLLHGAKGTPGEMRDLGNYLYSKGFTVFCPRFSRVDLKERPASWESWVTLADSTYGSMRDYSEEDDRRGPEPRRNDRDHPRPSLRGNPGARSSRAGDRAAARAQGAARRFDEDRVALALHPSFRIGTAK